MIFLSGAFVRGSNQNVDICIVGDMNKAQLAKIVGDMEQEMSRELNYWVMRVEDFDYRRNLNDRSLMDILDAKKIVLLDTLEIFGKAPVESTASAGFSETDLSGPNPNISTDDAIKVTVNEG
jgi:hypothetical protein